MNWMPVATTAAWITLLPLSAQYAHFDGRNWKERQTDHFTIRSEDTNSAPASKYAEKIWDLTVAILPGLKDEFAKNRFRTPSGDKGADAAPYRHTVYLIGETEPFLELVRFESKRRGWGEANLQLVRRVGNFADPEYRYGVFCKADTSSSVGKQRDVSPVFAHMTGATLLQGYSQTKELPFWMTAGFGYYIENALFRLCRVHYLDFEAYYTDKGIQIKKGETLGPDESWPRVLRRMSRKGERSSLREICNAEILSITPKDSGYILALTCFLVRNKEARENYETLVDLARDGGKIDVDMLLQTYEYDDETEFEGEWYKWIEGSDFK